MTSENLILLMNEPLGDSSSPCSFTINIKHNSYNEERKQRRPQEPVPVSMKHVERWIDNRGQYNKNNNNF